jgi:hypothetical protein
MDKKKKEEQGEGDHDEGIFSALLHGTNLNLPSQFPHTKRVPLVSLHESDC